MTGFITIDSLLAGNVRLFFDALWHLILPAFVLGWAVIGTISRLVRANMLEVLDREFILTARAKGASELRVVVRHALRNTLVPTLTVIGYSFAYLITGAVLTETIFSWPGMGSYAVDAARGLDFPAIIGVTIVGGAAFLLTNLITDIAYVVCRSARAAEHRPSWPPRRSRPCHRPQWLIAPADRRLRHRPVLAGRHASSLQ